MGLSSLTILIVAALLAGVGLATAGFVIRGGGDDVVLQADDAIAEVIPSTVAPRLDATSTADNEVAGSEDAAVVGFLAGFAELIEKYGHRGPNEWDMRASSWFTTPDRKSVV